ncbi:acyltransferase family protein [Cupriavidus sp. CuC1]|uniref:acyltransferase family protein n=1 Tax=Cupriavidus sp. CuC1 TaxID=3373131 RepID=UPI0037D26424
MKKTHIVQLDAIRFLAALAVVLYHYTAHDFETAAAPVTRFGFLGVPFFFIISGFVITMSLSGSSSPTKFLIDRAIRLYPSFFFCSVITVGFVAFLTNGPYFTVYDFFANMTMFGGELHARRINGAYWSLAVEWMFYFMMFSVFWVIGRKNLHWFLWVWIAASGLATIYDLGIVRRLFTLGNAPFFIAGTAIYLIAAGDKSRWMRALVLFSLPVAIFWEEKNAILAGMEDAIGAIVVALSVVGFYTLIAIVAHLPRRPSSPKVLEIAGRASYPLYLLHETIGVHILRSYYEPGLSGFFLVVGLTLGMIALSFLIAEYIERPAIGWLKRASVRRHLPATSV